MWLSLHSTEHPRGASWRGPLQTSLKQVVLLGGDAPFWKKEENMELIISICLTALLCIEIPYLNRKIIV